MKPVILLLFIFLFSNSLALAQSYEDKYDSDNGVISPRNNKPKKWCGAHTTGIVLSGIGAGMIVGGLVEAAHEQATLNNLFPEGEVVAGIGILVFAVGGGLAIGGIIHDHNRHHKISLIARKSKEMGLAFNL